MPQVVLPKSANTASARWTGAPTPVEWSDSFHRSTSAKRLQRVRWVSARSPIATSRCCRVRPNIITHPNDPTDVTKRRPAAPDDDKDGALPPPEEGDCYADLGGGRRSRPIFRFCLLCGQFLCFVFRGASFWSCRGNAVVGIEIIDPGEMLVATLPKYHLR